MDGWNLLNSLRKSVYCGEGVVDESALEVLFAKALKSDDTYFVQSVLHLKEDAGNVTANQRFMWLTSKVGSNFYPPLSLNMAGPIPWNQDRILKLGNFALATKYSQETVLKVDSNSFSGIEQFQDLSDCSLVASLINIRCKKVYAPPIEKVSECLYNINLHFNGIHNRLVSVDVSKIPTTIEGSQLSVNSNNILDKVIEAGYLLLTCASYDSPGSNTAIDTYRLTGFIPEVVKLQKYKFQKLSQFFNGGICLMAFGTGAETTITLPTLIENHDYPIVGVDEETQEILLRDPLSSTAKIRVSSKELNGNFKQLCLNWDSSKLFKNTKTLNFFYNSNQSNQFPTILDKPTFSLTNNSKHIETVWVLLETHLSNSNPKSKEGVISYLQEVKDNGLYNLTTTPEGACDIGLQLLKLELPASSSKNLFCHSSTNNTFTIHAYSISPTIMIKRDKLNKKGRNVEYSIINDGYEKSLSSSNYFQNPTFELEVRSATILGNIIINFQLLSSEPNDFVNLQIFHMDDINLTKPIIFDNDYSQQKYEKPHIPLTTNTRYQIICSTHSIPVSNRFKLFVSPSELELSSQLTIKLNQVYLEYGGYAYQIQKSYTWKENINAMKLELFTTKTTDCFIRIVPHACSLLLSMRCNIYAKETGQQIHKQESFEKVSFGGLVIPDIHVQGPSTMNLIVEKTDNISSSFVIYIGSRSKIIFNEML